jgi:hypothetical protein
MKTIIEVLIDNSRSMGPFEVKENNGQYLLPDGSTRMSLAKTILKNEFVPTFDYASRIIVRKFHSNDEDNNELVIETIYDTNLDTEILRQRIEEIPDPVDTGGTPITDAIKYSISELSKYPEADRKIILVTDGEETGEGDYNKAAQKALELHGIPCNVFIIGIALTPNAEIKAKGLATDTGGSYVNLRTKVYNKESLESLLRPFQSAVISTSIENNVHPISTIFTPIEKPIPVVSPAPKGIEEQPIIKQPDSPLSAKSDEEPQLEIPPQFDEVPVIADITDEINNQDFENKNSISVFSEQLEQNTTAIKLMSKQLAIIINELIEIKKGQISDNDEEVTISENSELNERVRLASESFLFEKLKLKFGDRLNWLNEKGESGKSHDFEVLDLLDNSIEYYIECKGSMHSDKIFYLTKNEWHFFLHNVKNYQLYFVSNALTNPTLVKIDNFKDWLMNGKVVPYVSKNIKLKADRIAFTIYD